MILDTIIYYTLYAFGSVVIICEMGQRLCNAFAGIGDFCWQMDWYLYSSETQKFLPTLLIAVQKPVVVEFFGSLSCSRESQEKVIIFN